MKTKKNVSRQLVALIAIVFIIMVGGCGNDAPAPWSDDKQEIAGNDQGNSQKVPVGNFAGQTQSDGEQNLGGKPNQEIIGNGNAGNSGNTGSAGSGEGNTTGGSGGSNTGGENSGGTNGSSGTNTGSAGASGNSGNNQTGGTAGQGGTLIGGAGGGAASVVEGHKLLFSTPSSWTYKTEGTVTSDVIVLNTPSNDGVKPYVMMDLNWAYQGDQAKAEEVAKQDHSERSSWTDTTTGIVYDPYYKELDLNGKKLFISGDINTYWGTPSWSEGIWFAKEGNVYNIQLDDLAEKHLEAIKTIVETVDRK